MYSDVKKVLEDIRIHFGKIYSEEFDMSRSYRDDYATYKSKSYLFEVMAGFIQARVVSDFLVPVEDRIDAVLHGAEVVRGGSYRLTSKNSDGPIPIEYCIHEIDVAR